ncbi:MAG TPA: hypothetical protein VE343_03005 [Streptosporangiaceae bacterium]|nr:hypothetical protein [Streptosporangiaceae bacterium]
MTLQTQDEMERELIALRVAPPLTRPGIALRATAIAQRAAAWIRAHSWPILVYAGTRIVLLLVAWLDVIITRHPLAGELSLFDGRWYLAVLDAGYPDYAVHGKSTLGFLPAYPLAIRAVATVTTSSPLVAALLISLAGGLVTAVLLGRLTGHWWGERGARKAVLVYCLFPGSIVFSMAYSECLTLPLVLGCLLALRRRRWALAGAQAAVAGAVEPAAAILILVCLAVAWQEIASAGWQDRAARRSLLAPLLAPAGLAAFAVYLWDRTGTPFASLAAQRYGWHQGDPFALLDQPVAQRLLAHPVSVFGHLGNFSLWNGLLGTVFLLFALRQLWRYRDELSPGTMVWTLGVGAMTLWSVMTLTNARMLLIAFPAVVIWARVLEGRRFRLFLAAETAVFVLASALTLAGLMLP